MGIEFPTVLFGNRGVNPPAASYLSEADQLHVISQTIILDPFVVAARVLLPNGKIQNMLYTVQPTVFYTPEVNTFPLCEGFLLGLAVYYPYSGRQVSRGTTFVSVWIGLGQANAITFLHPLVSEYVATRHPIGWPGGQLRHPIEGPGRFAQYGPLSVAGNGQALFNLPAHARWRFESVRFQLITSATVAARIPIITIQGGISQPLWSRLAPGSQGATTTVDYHCASGDSDRGVAQGLTNIGAPVDIFLSVNGPSATEIFVQVIAGVASDTLQNVILTVEEWLDTGP